jgi:hypothetical protein
VSKYEVHFGWTENGSRHCHDPLLRESLESALKSIGYPKWWEVRDRETGQVVASEKIGILPGLGSLLARQILSTLPLLLHGDEYGRVVGDVEVCTDVWSSKDDGETWDLVLAQDSEKSYSPCSSSRVARAKGA